MKNNNNKIVMMIILGALVISVGSVAVSRTLSGTYEEEIVAPDMIDEEHRIDDVTIEGDKLVYKDNGLKYVKYVILDYVPNTSFYVEDTYYWFNTEEEYHDALREYNAEVIDYNSETLMVRTMSDAKDKEWSLNISELSSQKNINIIR